IGNHVLIAGNSAVQDSDGHPSDTDRRMRGETELTEADIAPVTIHDHAWLGRGAQVLKGVTVGRGAVVAAGSVAVSEVPDGGLELGADDYVAKPFKTRVLLARVAALLRREAARASGGAAAEAPVVRGELAIDLERLEVRWRGERLATTVTELRIVEQLARRPG